MRSNSTVGQEVPQVNAKAKVTGLAKYVGDLFFPGMLHGKILRSTEACAQIESLSTAAAAQMPGVVAVLTGADAPAHGWGVMHKERHILARETVRFFGEEVALVVAETEHQALDAMDQVAVVYQPLAANFAPAQALEATTAAVHAGRSNVAHRIECERGDVQAGFAQAAAVIEETFTTHAQYPGYMEPNGVIALVDEFNRLQVYLPCHSIFLMRSHIAAALGLAVSQVKVIQTTTGGAFGQKMLEDDTCLVACLAAWKLRRPVKIINSRLEDFYACPSSVPEIIKIRMGMNQLGEITAKQVQVIADCGAYCGIANQVLHVSAMRSDNMHSNRNVKVEAQLVYTNNPPHGAFRGFGGSQMQFALNSCIDILAGKLGLDVLQVHKINAIEAGTESLHGWKIGSNGLRQCLDQCAQAIDWAARKKALAEQSGDKRRGLGVATAIHVSGNRTMGDWDGSTVTLRVLDDGRVQLITGECDVGQGANTVLSQLVAHELDLPLAQILLVNPDTDSASFALGAIGSRVTIVAGNACLKAAQELLAKATQQARQLLRSEQVAYRSGVFFDLQQPERTATLGAVARASVWQKEGQTLQVTTSWDPQTVQHDRLYGNVAPAYSFVAQVVEVEVDIGTGKVRVLDSFVSDDCGKAINPLAVHGQTNGATVQAIGWALFEHLKSEDGRFLNANYADYTLPTADAIPMLRNGLVESLDPNGPLGAKGASETAIQPGAAAIANAVFDAIGVRIQHLPITPERILEALDQKAAR